MLLSDLRRDYLLTQIVDLSDPDAAQQLADTFAALEEQAYQEYEAENIDRSRVQFLALWPIPLPEPGTFHRGGPAERTHHCRP